MQKTVCHKNGTVSYWSVYRQQYVKQAANVPDNELAAMAIPERNRVIKHLQKFACPMTWIEGYQIEAILGVR